MDYGRISRCPRCTSQANEPGERDLGDKIGKEKKNTLGKELELRGINLLVNQGEIKNCCIYSWKKSLGMLNSQISLIFSLFGFSK